MKNLTKTDSYSELATNFKKYLQKWDAAVSTHDDREMQELTRERFMFCIVKVNEFLNGSDHRAMMSEETDEAKVKAMIKNQKKPLYQDLKKAADMLTVMMCQFQDLYELKNRKTNEIFRLSAENAKLRQMLNKK